MSGILNENDSYLVREQILHNEQFVHEAKMGLIYDETVIMLVQRLGCTISKDGDKWCCLYGENIQEGICGWGETPYQSALNFRKEFMGEKGGHNA